LVWRPDSGAGSIHQPKELGSFGPGCSTQSVQWDYRKSLLLKILELTIQLFYPPGTTKESLKAKPFLVYSDEFYNIIGSNPTVTLIAKTDSDPLFHEAVVWYPPTDEVFFVQNAGAAEAGTGLAKSAIIQKIALSQADTVTNLTDASGKVDVVVVDSQPQVINPNGESAS
jgi:gluconolactonase